jgi:DNA-binding NarL/FixJ family response regulator
VEVALAGLTGAEVTARLCLERPARKVLALTACEDRVALRLVLAAGASGYVLKRAPADELVRAIRAVVGGATYLDPAVAGGVVSERVGPLAGNETRPAELSERETEVARLIVLGYSNKEIAARLQLSVKTVETYKTRAMEKLGMKGRVDLVRYAARRGWFDVPELLPPARPVSAAPVPLTAEARE